MAGPQMFREDQCHCKNLVQVSLQLDRVWTMEMKKMMLPLMMIMKTTVMIIIVMVMMMRMMMMRMALAWCRARAIHRSTHANHKVAAGRITIAIAQKCLAWDEDHA